MLPEVVFGVISGMVTATGMGGGTILILLFNLFGNIAQHEVQGINLIFFIPTSIVAIYMNIKHKTIDYKVSSVLIIFGIIGAICGSFLSFKIDSQNLKKYFGFFLILIAFFQVYLYFKDRRKAKNRNT